MAGRFSGQLIVDLLEGLPYGSTRQVWRSTKSHAVLVLARLFLDQKTGSLRT
jgi:hypothetical protein